MADWAAYLGIGAAVGFFAGLLGIGGGVIIVSSLAVMFTHQGFPPEYVMHCAVGTSLAAIIAGAWGSFRAHDRRGAVDWATVKAMIPGLLAGVVGGAAVARFMKPGFLKYFFIGFMTLVAIQLVFNLRPKASRELPGRGGRGRAVPHVVQRERPSRDRDRGGSGVSHLDRGRDRLRGGGIQRARASAVEPGLRVSPRRDRDLGHEPPPGAAGCAARASPQ